MHCILSIHYSPSFISCPLEPLISIKCTWCESLILLGILKSLCKVHWREWLSNDYLFCELTSGQKLYFLPLVGGGGGEISPAYFVIPPITKRSPSAKNKVINCFNPNAWNLMNTQSKWDQQLQRYSDKDNWVHRTSAYTVIQNAGHIKFYSF